MVRFVTTFIHKNFARSPSILLKPEFRTKFFENGKTVTGEDTHYAYGWYDDEFNGRKMKMHTGAWVVLDLSPPTYPKQIHGLFLSNYRGISIGDTAKVFLKEFVK